MEKTLTPVANCLPDVIKNTHLNLSLDGWPAAVAVMAICTTIIGVTAICVTQPGESTTPPPSLAYSF